MMNLEKKILSTMMNSKDARNHAILSLKQTYFEENNNRSLFVTILELHAKDLEPDLTAMFNAINSKGLEIPISYVTEISSNFLSAVNFLHDCAVLIEKFLRKEFLSVIKKLEKDYSDKTKDVFEVHTETIAKLESIINDVNIAEDEKQIKEIAESVILEMMEERKGDKEIGLKSEWFPSLNEDVLLRPSNFMVVSGEYKSGKSTFSLSLAMDYAMNKNKRVGVLSLEMSNTEVVKKMISLVTGTRYGYLRNPSEKNRYGELRFSEDKFNTMIQNVNRKFNDANIFVRDNIFGENEIKALVKYWVVKKNVEVIIIDYVGLIEASVRRERRDLEVSAISRSLKLLAKKLNCVIIILSQENNEGKIAESKGLARDADFWVSISHPIDESTKGVKAKHPETGDEIILNSDPSLFKVHIRANRHSQSGGVFFCYLQENGRFLEMDLTMLNQYQGQGNYKMAEGNF